MFVRRMCLGGTDEMQRQAELDAATVTLSEYGPSQPAAIFAKVIGDFLQSLRNVFLTFSLWMGKFSSGLPLTSSSLRTNESCVCC